MRRRMDRDGGENGGAGVRIDGVCPKCNADVSFEQFQIENVICGQCGAELEVIHDCDYYPETDEEEYCSDYLMPAKRGGL